MQPPQTDELRYSVSAAMPSSLRAPFSTPEPGRAYAKLDPRQARGRLVVALAAALIAGLLAPAGMEGAVRLVAGWDAAALCLTALSWIIIWASSAEQTRRRAAAYDPGRTAGWVLVVIASAVSLFAAASVLRKARTLAPLNGGVLTALCLGAVVGSWCLTHTSYALRYAHLYYRDDDEGEGGLAFPGGALPDAFDFAYFSFTVGMCFQAGDVTVTSSQLRRAVLGHAVLSFAYNTTVLALALNLVFGRLG
jgi:uncharacterized membrane protein